MRYLLAIQVSLFLLWSSEAHAIASSAKSFCDDPSQKGARFNDSQGFTNSAIRQGKLIKVYREVAAPSLDWAVYDSYAFSAGDGARLAFSRVVIYAGSGIVFTQIVDAKGKSVDNRNILPDDFFVPSEPELAKLPDFCQLTTKSSSRR